MPKYSLPDSGAIIISGSAADKLLSRKDGKAALVYLYILKMGGDVSADDISSTLNMTMSDTKSCLYALSAMGLINENAGKTKDSAAEYTAEELAKAMEGEEFSFIVSEAENVFSSILNGEDLKRLYNIYHGIGLPAEVILHMMQFFKSEVRRKYGPGRRLSMAALEKMAFEWSRLGIVTLDDAENYIRRQERRSSMEGEIKRSLGISDRRLSAGERVFIDSWTDMGFGPDAIGIAAERTLNRVHSLNFKYMDKIFLSWHSKGLHTAEEIEKNDPYEAPRRAAKKQDAAAQGPTSEDIENLRRFIESMQDN